MLRGILHHVSLEVHPDEVERSIEFFQLVGFSQVSAPEPIDAFVTWLEHDGTQVHLIHTPEPTTPALGHPAVVAADFGAAVSRLREAAFEVVDADELWGERRAFAVMPGGHRVELMAAPPPATAG
jgi:catechol 2,3-dioxygenase-like lactoylglutathione lyase family enzyme